MPRFGNTIGGLKEISSHLEGIEKQANSTRSSLGGVQADAARAAASLSTFDAQTEKTKANQRDLRKELDESKQSFDVLDDIQRRSNETTNVFSEKFNLSIEAVKIGATTLDQFIATWGDAILQTEDGGKRIRDLFSDVDFGKYQREIQDLIKSIDQGGTDLGEVIAFVEERAGNLAKGLINVLKLFQQGKATLDDVARALDAAKEAFPGVEGDALADAIRDGLLAGVL